MSNCKLFCCCNNNNFKIHARIKYLEVCNDSYSLLHIGLSNLCWWNVCVLIKYLCNINILNQLPFLIQVEYVESYLTNECASLDILWLCLLVHNCSLGFSFSRWSNSLWFVLQIIGIWLAFRYRNLKDPRANPGAFLWWFFDDSFTGVWLWF